MTSPSSFNLIDEPWVRVRTLDGLVEERSLRDVLANASGLRGLAGELPTQDAAILRLLLAVILGATRPARPRGDAQALAQWDSWWSNGAIPMEVLDSYLASVRGRFELFDPEAPFFQVAGLTTASGRTSGLTKLIADFPDGHPFFTTRGGEEITSISPAEAARWLVHCQAFDPSGIKTGAVGDSRVKGGKGYPFGYPAWAGNLGLIIAEGDSLFETLLLNTPWRTSGPEDRPVWDRLPLGPDVEVPEHLPRGPADLFTWPSRRLRLFTADGQVTDVQISNGDKLTPKDLFRYESMSAWRYSKNQSKGSDKVYMPKLHDPSRRIWQGLGSVLVNSASPQDQIAAPAIEWLATLRGEGVLSDTQVVDLHVVGLEYGTQNAVVAGAIDDRLTASVAAITHPDLAVAAIKAVERASQGVIALANLAGNLDRAAGGDGLARERVFERGYALLDSPFRRWIRKLTDPDKLAELDAAWDDSASSLIRTAGYSLLADAGPAALVGRVVAQINGETQQLDAGLAQIWFNGALAKAFPFRTLPTEVKR